mgnify:CR=1 FL=1
MFIALLLLMKEITYNFLKLETLGASMNGMETGVINLHFGPMN